MEKNIIEDYFLEKENNDLTGKKLVLVIYDIISNKRRSKFVKLMESFGVRVQKSAFEMIITEAQYSLLIGKIPKLISAEDNIRVYKLSIRGEIVSWGSGMTVPHEVIIV